MFYSSLILQRKCRERKLNKKNLKAGKYLQNLECFIMTSTESVQIAKKGAEATKKSPLKVVSPILKKYSGHRQGKIKKKLKFPRILHGSRSKQKKQIKPQLKSILPKTNAGDVIILEPELLPCAINPQKRKKKEDEIENGIETNNKPTESEVKTSENLPPKECSNKLNKSKILSNNNNKKKIKCLKNIEASLELLESNTSTLKEKREQAFAENYLLRVQQKLKGKEESLYNQFVDLICNFQVNGISVCDLFKKIKSLFSSHSDLCDDFIAFLTPEQAMECGVFMDHLLLTTMTDFLNMIDIYFSKSPQQIKKIHSVLESLATKPNLSTDDVTSSVLPLLKGNPVLRDYFLQLIPNARPPDNFFTDYEEVEYPELNSDVSDDEEIMEMVHLPEVDDPFGGDLCPCKCHNVEIEKSEAQGQHCISCSLKFINGKIFIQNGKLLRPARVVFEDHDMNYHRDRLAPKLYPKRGRKRHRNALFKDSLSPTKSCNLSSDEFKSDIEEDDKGRLKVISSKSPRINRKKSVSPKHCDKLLSKCPVGETKTESIDFEDKPVLSKSLDFSFVKDEEKVDVSKTEIQSKKSEQFDFITFSCDVNNSQKQSETEEDVPPSKPLDLPKIDMDETLENSKPLLSMVSLNDSSKSEIDENGQDFADQAEVFKERSRSPPVISIPETATPLFSNSKPILSFLEKLDDSKESPLLLDNSERISLDQSPESSKEDVVEGKEEENSLPWKIEEDRIILQTLQVEENSEETFLKIGKNIPARSVEDIKKRFAELMNMFYEMKAKTSAGEQ